MFETVRSIWSVVSILNVEGGRTSDYILNVLKYALVYYSCL